MISANNLLSLKVACSGGRASIDSSTATHELSLPTGCCNSRNSELLAPQQYDEVPGDDDSVCRSSLTSSSNRGLNSDDSLLQHPLSVCVSRAVSSNELYACEPLDFQYPICKVDDLSPDLHQESESGHIFSEFGREESSDKGVPFYPSLSEPISRRESGYSPSIGNFEDNRMEEQPDSLTPAYSIGAISAITGVSCFDEDVDDVNAEVKAEVIDVFEMKTEALSLLSGPSSPNLGMYSPYLVMQRAQSEPLQSIASPHEDSLAIEKQKKVVNSPRRHRLKHKRKRKRERPGPKPMESSYDSVVSTAPRSIFPITANTRKKLLPPVYDPTFQLAKELSTTEKTYLNSLRFILMMCESPETCSESLSAEVAGLVGPLYLLHSHLQQAAAERVAAWERAAVDAAAARSHFQAALASSYKAQRSRHKRTTAQMRRASHRGSHHQSQSQLSPSRAGDCSTSCHRDEGQANDLSDSSTSVSGIPRSSSRNDLPPSIEHNRDRAPPADGCNLTSSTTSCSFNSSSEASETNELGTMMRPMLTIGSTDLVSVERELLEASRSLMDHARIADVYQEVLLVRALPYYEALFRALLRLLKQYLTTREASENISWCPPIFALLRIPSRRLWYYCLSFKRLLVLCGEEHVDLDNCQALVSRLTKLLRTFESVFRTAEACALVFEFCQGHRQEAKEPKNSKDRNRQQQCLTALFSRVINDPKSQLIRVGFLEKMSSRGRGFQPRMALLFSDRLVYCGRVTGSPAMHLKVHGVVSLHNAGVESRIKSSVSFSEGISQESKSQSQKFGRERHSFAILIFSNGKSEKAPSGPSSKAACGRTHRVVFAAPSLEQKRLWLSALNVILGPKKGANSDSRQDSNNADEKLQGAPGAPEAQNLSANNLGLLGPRSHLQQTVLRCSGLAYVCWHRRLSLSLDNILNASRCEISGYLLRKFKSSCGWQKLWTVFTDLTLFFYKSPEELAPIASLPLLGYRLELTRPTSTMSDPATASTTTAIPTSDVQSHPKFDILQLTYKSHTYYFRTDASNCLERWYHSLSTALNSISLPPEET